MNVKSYPLFAGAVFAIASLSFPLKANAQYQVPPVYMPDTNALSNGGMALELCKQYIYKASTNPNNLELQQVALFCQNLQLQYVQCIIRTPPEQGLICMENASDALDTLLPYISYLQ